MNNTTEKCPKCDGKIKNGSCLLCSWQAPEIVQWNQELNVYRSLVIKFHQSVTWGHKRIKSGVSLTEIQYRDFFLKVEKPLEEEYQRLILIGVPYETLWKIMGKVNLYP